MPLNPSDNSVDDYMARLAVQLKPLPAAERAAHLLELRQHVEQLISAHTGHPDAVQSALSEMGNPVEIGQNLLREWRKQSRVFWQTVIIVGVCQMILSEIPRNFAFSIFHWVDGTNGRGWTSVYNTLALLPPIIAGVSIGRRLPEQAVPAAFLAGSLASLCSAVLLFCQSSQWNVFLFGVGVSGNEMLAAYVASSLKRKDWTLHLR